MHSLNRIFIRSIVVAISMTAAMSCATDEAEKPSPQSSSIVQTHHQSIRLLDLDGNPVDFWPQKRSAITVVLFTRSDCPISNRFAPEINHLYEMYHPRGVNFGLVYVDPHEQPEAIRRHLQEFGYSCTALRDPEHSLVAYCKATITPEAAVFDRNGMMVYRGRVNDLYMTIGNPRPEPTMHDLADAIESAVNGRPVATPRTRAVGCAISDLKD